MLQNVCKIAGRARSSGVPARFASVWAKVEKGPEDPILGVTVAFNKDTHADKINLGVGAYRDDNNKPFVLDCVRKAEQKIFEAKVDHEYTPIGGSAAFNKLAQSLVFGEESAAVKAKRIVTVQAISGTGALRVGADFMKRFVDVPLGPNGKKVVYVPQPTWGNHIPIYQDAGMDVKFYKYYNDKTCGLDFEGMANDLKTIPSQSIVLLHACAHNPTGVDPSPEQWKAISAICKEKGHFLFVDLAYQGFASGDPERDALAVRLLVQDGHNIGVSQSFAKNFGLYGERIGALSFVTASAEEAERVESQLKILIRPMYSNPPVYGARVVSEILASKELTSLWRTEVKVMADRIIDMRSSLRSLLKEFGSKRDWSHITNQIGMFCYSGMKPEEVDALARDHHVYLTRNGRISVAGITSKNVKHLAKSMVDVTKGL
eukprot:TRINITY_DN105_c0_g1_i1.p1 TRINITY_DN105_c0_g1~~TRINITY_DN105_c0_g1_i1.p1  ORF type:complete len:449 (+),score=169.59 TRINITY_DN105_c0_g1_i1:55-1347(+)